MLSKIRKSGNNLAVSLPNEIIAALGIAEGDEVSIELNRATSEIIIRPASATSIPGVDTAFARQVDQFIEQYRPALDELAKK